ncbi:TRAP transporter substrate-binding protein [Bosea sp. LjRoot9]|uniref:TRAP transporter substrate-binding protein n=1 Tax=Bosea sp. LjRoot9 TaxID=3342341 RepID=UPI003ED0F216
MRFLPTPALPKLALPTLALALGLICSALAQPALAQEARWDVINEYPASSLPGEADSFFAEAVKAKAAGKLTITPIPDAKSGLRTREQLKAVSDGRFAMANSFGGALGDEAPLFLLSSLPFVTASTADARALYDAAKPLYEKLFATRGQKLLYISPWPPSGIWSAAPLKDLAALKALKIRTYDKTGTEVLAQVAASAGIVSFSDLNPKLDSGEINAVLSSGDGGAGRQLWKYTRNFSEILYAVPLSFASVSLDAWQKLDATTQAAVEAAAAETSEHQWQAMSGRVAINYKRMRDNGVTIDDAPPKEVMEALRAAAAQSVAQWKTTADPAAQQVLTDFLARPR